MSRGAPQHLQQIHQQEQIATQKLILQFKVRLHHGSFLSAMPMVYMFALCHHWPNMSKTQPLVLDTGSRWLENRHENCMYNHCTAELVTKLILQTLSTDYNRILRCTEEGQSPVFQSRYTKIRCRSARKKAQILKMLTSRWRYVQIAGNSVFCILC